MFTPERISKLEPNQIFVFGSNLHGQHAGGAARVAFDKFGAIWGQGVGMQGQCYAIPTMQGGVETIKPYVDEFIEFAKAHTEYTFLVTRIGCGIAGFKDSQIAPLFTNAMNCDNIALPKEFVDVLSLTAIQTSCGEVKRVKDKWLFHPTNTGDKNIVEIPYTDHWTIDSFLIRHNGKYGIYSLPDMGDFGNDGNLKWVGLDEEPFPYDEVRVQGMHGGFYGKIAYRKDGKWGIMHFFFIPSQDRVDKYDIVPCEYSSLEEAAKHLPVWENPFDRKVEYQEW